MTAGLHKMMSVSDPQWKRKQNAIRKILAQSGCLGEGTYMPSTNPDNVFMLNFYNKNNAFSCKKVFFFSSISYNKLPGTNMSPFDVLGRNKWDLINFVLFTAVLAQLFGDFFYIKWGKILQCYSLFKVCLSSLIHKWWIALWSSE